MQYNFYDYTIKVFPDVDDGGFIATLEEMPNCSAFGDTPLESLKELEIAFDGCVKASIENNITIPSPSAMEKNENYSGKFSVRLPVSLHKQLARQAKNEKISLNQEVVYCLTRGLSINH